MSQHHDAIFSFTFSQPEHLIGLLHHLLPAVLVAALDLSTLQQERVSFVDEHLRRQQADVLYTVQCAGQPVFVYLLFEHKSQDEGLTAWQLFGYVGRIWARHMQEHPDSRQLPPIVPMVLHHGEHGWRVARTLRACIDCGPPSPAAEALRALQPELSFTLLDLHGMDEAALRGLKGSALMQLTMLCLQCLPNCEGPEAVAVVLQRWMDLLRLVATAPTGHHMLAAVCSYVLSVTNVPTERLRQVLAEELGQVAEQAVMSTAERIAQEAAEKALVKGRGEMLLMVLTGRFGSLPKEIEAQVLCANRERLKAWAELALQKSSLAEIFANG